MSEVSKILHAPWWAEKREHKWQVSCRHRGPGSSFCIAEINGWTDDAEATARMAAASPELFAALKWFIDDIDSTRTVMLDFDANVERARKALAKALGERAQ